MISSVIDIGSNSIKLLVAEGKNATPIFEALSETRLSPETESARERISEKAFAAGIRAVCELAEAARKFSPEREAITGTSLFRTAENASEFARAVKDATGTPMRILSGIEEAQLVAAGVATDPSICLPCAIFDLGGGSLEFIAKNGDENTGIFETSRKLGAVRLTRKFFKNPTAPIPEEEISALRKFVREEISGEILQNLPRNAQTVFCGGSAGICSHLVPEKSATALETLLTKICAGTLEERIAAGVPAKRADIFPAAVAALAEVCAVAGISVFAHTHRNLRYGLCARLNAENT